MDREVNGGLGSRLWMPLGEILRLPVFQLPTPPHCAFAPHGAVRGGKGNCGPQGRIFKME